MRTCRGVPSRLVKSIKMRGGATTQLYLFDRAVALWQIQRDWLEAAVLSLGDLGKRPATSCSDTKLFHSNLVVRVTPQFCVQTATVGKQASAIFSISRLPRQASASRHFRAPNLRHDFRFERCVTTACGCFWLSNASFAHAGNSAAESWSRSPDLSFQLFLQERQHSVTSPDPAWL